MSKALIENLCAVVFLTILLLNLSLQGCLSVGRNYEQLFDDAKLNQIKSGVTAKHELLKKFGPPVAIIEEGKDFLRPVDLPKSIDFISARAILTARNNDSNNHRIYYYYYFSRRGLGSIPPIIYLEWDFIHNLWVLVDEEKQLVVDFLYVETDSRGEFKEKRKKAVREFRKLREEYEKTNQVIDGTEEKNLSEPY